MSAWLSSESVPDRPVAPPLKSPKATMATFRARRMIRFVKFRERTSLLEDALETTSRAVWRKGADTSVAEARASMADPTIAVLETESMVMMVTGQRRN